MFSIYVFICIQRMRWLDDIIDTMDISLNKLQKIVNDREGLQRVVYDLATLQQQILYICVKSSLYACN